MKMNFAAILGVLVLCSQVGFADETLDSSVEPMRRVQSAKSRPSAEPLSESKKKEIEKNIRKTVELFISAFDQGSIEMLDMAVTPQFIEDMGGRKIAKEKLEASMPKKGKKSEIEGLKVDRVTTESALVSYLPKGSKRSSEWLRMQKVKNTWRIIGTAPGYEPGMD